MITAENAQYFQKLAAEKRVKNSIIRAKDEASRARAEQILELARQGIADEYRVQELLRVRLQIGRLNDMLDTEKDSHKLDSISRAMDRLSKRERELAGRPLPGTEKPRAKRRDIREIIESDPLPAEIIRQPIPLPGLAELA